MARVYRTRVHRMTMSGRSSERWFSRWRLILKMRRRFKMSLALRISGRKDEDLTDVGDVLLDELDIIKKRREVIEQRATTEWMRPNLSRNPYTKEAKLEEYYKEVHELDPPLSALCFSGGGIRSAAFALGIAQALANRGVLPRFDYLSTVSGGGYFG
jgi:Patatin-like phospholipase